ncbi:MAG: hypothetical protein ACI9YE_002986 [Psychroserpens sp.]|jgi:hypothetical protein
MDKVDDFDFNFLPRRIEQLLKQCGLFEEANFWNVFGTLGNEARFDYCSWSLSTKEYTNYKDSEFYSLFMTLLDIFIQYRSQYVISDHYHCLISVEMSVIHVEWVSKDVADMIVATLRGNENVHS